MWAKIATFKENLSQIASDVQDTAEELDIEIGGGRPRVRISDTSASSDRSVERKFADVNGSDDSVRAELEWYKGEIQRLQKSEAEIQAMSVNYASLLKDREEELQKMHDNYEKLKKLKAGATEESQLLNSDKRESSQVMNGSKKQADVHTQGNQITQHGKNTNMGNGFSTEQEEKQLRMELLLKKLIEKEKELPQLLQEKSEAFVDLKNENEKLKNEIERLKASRGKDHAALLNSSSQVQRKPEHFHNTKKEWSELLAENQHMSKQIVDLQKKLNEKTVEVNKLNEKLRKGTIYPKEYVEKLQNSIATLEKEKTALKTENDGLLDKVSRHEQQSLRGKTDTDADRLADKSLEGSKEINTLTENGDLVGEASHLRILELEQSLQNAMKERDKALRDLSRLKQHLLAKEQEDTEKMDQDSERITELQAELDAKTRKILHLERTLDQAVASQEEVKRINTGELQRANEKISELQQKLAGCVSALEAKDTELQNLQTVLGQYYAEIESKERVYGELAAARDELSKLSQTMKELSQVIESRDKENSELLEKLGFAERRLAETLQTRERLEDEIVRLRRALEQSMTRLNRMSVDSDYLVDRRIVIKLLVTYFQRQHSKEVLDLMVRILGFSDEDKQRIGIAQQVAGKGVVRGVLGLPGRLVGGILGSGTSDTSFSLPSENQSFSDLWIDFLLKESEEREKRENAEAHTTTSAISGNSMNSVNSTVASHSASPLIYSNVDRMTKIDASKEVQWGSSADSEFSTVPLNSGNSYSSSSSIHQPRLAPK